MLIDTLGLLLAVVVTETNFPERLGGAVVVEAALFSTQCGTMKSVNKEIR